MYMDSINSFESKLFMSDTHYELLIRATVVMNKLHDLRVHVVWNIMLVTGTDFESATVRYVLLFVL